MFITSVLTQLLLKSPHLLRGSGEVVVIRVLDQFISISHQYHLHFFHHIFILHLTDKQEETGFTLE